jgi:hypothetical protein
LFPKLRRAIAGIGIIITVITIAFITASTTTIITTIAGQFGFTGITTTAITPEPITGRTGVIRGFRFP